jgi:hypothetical protein
MANVTAKVRLASKQLHEDGTFASLQFVPDYADGRNAEWAHATPALNLTMTVRGAVADHFPLNRSYTLTFAPDQA